MSLRRRILAGTALLTAAAMLTACASGSTNNSGDAAGDGEAQAPEISFLYSPYADYAPFFIAEEYGYFEEAGVDVELISKSGNSGETYQQVSTGSVTSGGATWGAGLFNATKAGASISVIASVSRVPESGANPAPLVASVESGITDVKDLEGKKVGVPGVGGFGIYSVHLALEAAGLSLEDVELVNLSPGDIPAALANGSVSASWTIEPLSTAIMAQDLGVELLDVSYHAGVELGALAFNTEYIEEYPDAVVAFTAAYLRAVKVLEEGGWDDPEMQEIIADYTVMPVENLREIALTTQDPNGEINWEDVARQESFFRDRDTLEFEGDSGIRDIFREDILTQAIEASSAE